jgi:hypothetical protein
MARFELSDALVGAIEVRPNLGPGHVLTTLAWAGGKAPVGAESWASAGDVAGVGAVFRVTSWSGVAKLAECAAQGRDWNSNANGFRFAANRDSGDAAFEAVLVLDYMDEAAMSDAAFDALCVRAFEALKAVAAAKAPEVQSAAWWPGFVANAAAVAARCGAG